MPAYCDFNTFPKANVSLDCIHVTIISAAPQEGEMAVIQLCDKTKTK